MTKSVSRNEVSRPEELVSEVCFRERWVRVGLKALKGDDVWRLRLVQVRNVLCCPGQIDERMRLQDVTLS